MEATACAGSGLDEGPTTTIAVTLVAVILLGTISSLPAAAADTVQHARCVRMLRVTGVAADDVLFLRSSPQVPDPSEADNRLIGIPSEARRIEELDRTQEGWRHIRYMGQEGYARSLYLASDTIGCPVVLPASTDQPSSVRKSLPTPVIAPPPTEAGAGDTAKKISVPATELPVPSSTMPATTASIQAGAPASSASSALHTTIEEGYRIDEGFFRVTIKGRPYLLQGLVVEKTDAAGKLPIMIITHGTHSSANARQEMTPRGTKDSHVPLLRAYAQRGWLAVYVLRRGYGQSDGPIPVPVTKCDGSSPTLQEFSEADADDLQATLAYIEQREDADANRIMAFGMCGGGAAVVALGAREIPGLKIIVNVSGGLHNSGCSDVQNRERLINVARHYGSKSRVPNLWYYAQNDQYLPEQSVVEMRSAFLEGGGYAKLTHYGKIIDFATEKEVDGHQLWSKRASTIMLDIDNYLRSKGRLPTWNTDEAKRLTERMKIKTSELIEGYMASHDYKALAQSTTKHTGLAYFYGAATFELAKEGAITACKKYYPGHTCKVVDPPESASSP